MSNPLCSGEGPQTKRSVESRGYMRKTQAGSLPDSNLPRMPTHSLAPTITTTTSTTHTHTNNCTHASTDLLSACNHVDVGTAGAEDAKSRNTGANAEHRRQCVRLARYAHVKDAGKAVLAAAGGSGAGGRGLKGGLESWVLRLCVCIYACVYTHVYVCAFM